VNFCLKKEKNQGQSTEKGEKRSFIWILHFWFVSWSRLFRDKLIRQFRNVNVNWNEIETKFSRECSLIQKKKRAIQFISWPVKTKQDFLKLLLAKKRRVELDQDRLLYKETTRTEIYQVFFPHFWTTQRKIPKKRLF